jgi:hypothetical protein
MNVFKKLFRIFFGSIIWSFKQTRAVCPKAKTGTVILIWLLFMIIMSGMIAGSGYLLFQMPDFFRPLLGLM